MSFVELSRRAPFPGEDVEIVELAAQEGGSLAVDEDFRRRGLSFAPVEPLAPRWTLLTRRTGKRSVAWFLQSSSSLPDAAIRTALGTDPDFRPVSELALLPSAPPKDRPFRYRKADRGVVSACVGYQHPSPDTGDFYETERCFLPGKGITSLTLHSVWGRYQLFLVHP